MKTKLMFIFLLISICAYSQNGSKTIDQAFKSILAPSDSYFEVTKQMFQMLSEAKGISPEYKEYISKLHQLKMIQPADTISGHGQVICSKFFAEANLEGYALLMKKKEANLSQLSFYKKTNKEYNEFLLVSTEMIIYISGTINLKSIREFEQVMEVAGSAFEM